MEIEFSWRQIEQDKIGLDMPGFHWCSHGRVLTIYLVESESIVMIHGEMPGVKQYDVLIFDETEYISNRFYPNKKRVETIPQEERYQIQQSLVNWLEDRGIRHDIKVGT
ncbi:hypothetical protein [Paenibacillus gansuensis]|uniref:Uncharacterized protein n=1 Tax=Paenibacillus gansuensis TaxID=306542 RepID=A0ABW5PAS5_9BACL